MAKWVCPGKRLDPWVKTLLLSALYQYHYLQRVPDWAVTDESIEIAKRRRKSRYSKSLSLVFLHAILRKGLPDLRQINERDLRLSIENVVCYGG